MNDDERPGESAAERRARDIADDPDGPLGDDGSIEDDERHYLQDPDGLEVNERDEDERDQDDLLEPDQTELDELGLILDDPHQPESE